MEFEPDKKLHKPTFGVLETLKKQESSAVVEHLPVTVSPPVRKQELKTTMFRATVHQERCEGEALEVAADYSDSDAVKIRRLELDHEYRMKQLEFNEKEKQKELEIKEKEIALRMEQERIATNGIRKTSEGSPIHFNTTKYIRPVPPFQEAEIDDYFQRFEEIAVGQEWPRGIWTSLLQSVLVGKARDVYSAMSLRERTDYEVVKESILKAYEPEPEVYREKFRSVQKREDQTHIEFAREKEMLFDKWLTSKGVGYSFAKLRDLMLIEEFTRSIDVDMKVHLNEYETDTLHEIATVADNYSVTNNLHHIKDTSDDKDDSNIFLFPPHDKSSDTLTATSGNTGHSSNLVIINDHDNYPITNKTDHIKDTSDEKDESNIFLFPSQDKNPKHTFTATSGEKEHSSDFVIINDHDNHPITDNLDHIKDSSNEKYESNILMFPPHDNNSDTFTATSGEKEYSSNLVIINDHDNYPIPNSLNHIKDSSDEKSESNTFHIPSQDKSPEHTFMASSGGKEHSSNLVMINNHGNYPITNNLDHTKDSPDEQNEFNTFHIPSLDKNPEHIFKESSRGKEHSSNLVKIDDNDNYSITTNLEHIVLSLSQQKSPQHIFTAKVHSSTLVSKTRDEVPQTCAYCKEKSHLISECLSFARKGE